MLACDLLFSLARADFLLRGERRGGRIVGVCSSSLSDSLVASSSTRTRLHLALGERRGGGDVGVPGMVIWKI